MLTRLPWLALALVLAGCGTTQTTAPIVRLVRTPHEGLQPRVAVENGVLHLLYYRGEAAAGDLFYVQSTDQGRSFTDPIRVNSQPGSAIAAGTIRGGQMAIGKGGRVHVAWNGSTQAQPKGPLNPEQEAESPYNGTPFLYAHSNGEGGFTPQRNLMTKTFGLDGGGTIAADGAGNVYAAWHASTLGSAAGEAGRRLWLARSTDGGTNFGEEAAVSDSAQGACGCCSAHLFADNSGGIAAFYRTAREVKHRDGFLLTSTDSGMTFHSAMLQPWNIGACPMSSASFSKGPAGLFVAWETAGQVWFAPIDIASGGMTGDPVPAPGAGSTRKHPSLAQDAQGDILLVWAEVPSFGAVGSLHWQLFDAQRRPLGDSGSADPLPAWSFGTPVAADDGFVILY